MDKIKEYKEYIPIVGGIITIIVAVITLITAYVSRKKEVIQTITHRHVYDRNRYETDTVPHETSIWAGFNPFRNMLNFVRNPVHIVILALCFGLFCIAIVGGLFFIIIDHPPPPIPPELPPWMFNAEWIA